MKEYAIFQVINGGCPFFRGVFSNFNQARESLEILISYDREKNYSFFVDNDFFTNEYSINNVRFYYCIKEREVGKWSKCDNYILNSNSNNTRNKILKFEDYLSRKI